ncbi:MAG TPA: glycosyltransferase family 4 protein [Ignavibacteriaceae bacterium]|nr:glycosyltransferase family 4 protein [Ignavibacteriaceae bacterium]
MTKKKIYQICFGDGYAGSAKMAIMNSTKLSKNYDITFFATKDSLTEKRCLEAGLRTISIEKDTNFKDLLKIVSDNFVADEPDIVVSNHSLDRKVGLALRRKFKKKFLNIAYRHNESKSVPFIGSLLYNYYFDYSIACSEGVAQSLYSSGFKKKKVKVIHYGIEIPLDINDISGTSIKEKFNLQDKTVLGVSAWFHKERKGFDILFKAFSKLVGNYKLLIIGIPKEKQQEVLDYAAEFDIAPQDLIMPGYIENVWEYYKAMDIFLFPSRSEGFPIAPLEAGAAKLPIIASDIPGTKEYIIDSVTGLSYPVEEDNELVEAIKLLTEDTQLREALSTNAYNVVIDNYTLDVYARKLDEFFADIIKYR